MIESRYQVGSLGSFDWHFPGRKGCGIVLKILTIFASSFKNGLLSIFFICFVLFGQVTLVAVNSWENWEVKILFISIVSIDI